MLEVLGISGDLEGPGTESIGGGPRSMAIEIAVVPISRICFVVIALL